MTEPPADRIERIRQIAEQEDTFPASTVKFLLECIDGKYAISSEKVLDPKPGQMVVLTHPSGLAPEAVAKIAYELREHLPPGVSVVLVPQDYDLQVAQPEQTLASLFGR